MIGGGPAGCEAARVLATRGHKVALFEKENRLGGQFNLASLPPHKEDFRALVEFYQGELPRLGVEVRLGAPASREALRALGADLYVTATGSEPSRPPLPGVERPQVMTAHQVLAGERVVAEGPAVVLGGGATGLETAEFLAERGLTVAVVEMLDQWTRLARWVGVLLAAWRMGARFLGIGGAHTERRRDFSPALWAGGGVEMPGRGCAGHGARPCAGRTVSAGGDALRAMLPTGNGMAAIHPPLPGQPGLTGP